MEPKDVVTPAATPPPGQPEPAPSESLVSAMLYDLEYRRWLLRRGLLTVGVGVGGAAAVALALVVGIAAGLSYLLGSIGGSSAGSSSTSSGNTSDLLPAFFHLVSFSFFQIHQVPYQLVIGGATSSISGVGSLTVLLAVLVVAFLSGRRLEATHPLAGPATPAAFRAATLGLPYLLVCVLLLAAGNLSLALPLIGQVTGGPSLLALILPPALVALASAAGAVAARQAQVSSSQAELLQGVKLGVLASLIGAALALGGLAIGLALSFAIGGGAHLPTSGSSGSSAGPGSGVVFFLAAVVGAAFYLVNGLAVLWSQNLGLALWGSPLIAAPVFVFGLLGALSAVAQLKRSGTYSAQAAFAATFAVIAFFAAASTRVQIFGQSLGGDPVAVLISGLVIGGGFAFVGPLVSATPLGVLLADNAATRWVFQRANVGPMAIDGSPSGQSMPSGQGMRSGQSMPIVVSRRTRYLIGVSAAIVIVLGVGVVVGASLTNPAAAARAYVVAVGKNDPQQIWSMLTLDTSSAGQGTQTIASSSVLQAMLKIPANRHSDRSSVSVSSSSTNGDSATVVVSFVESGKQTSETLNLKKVVGENSFLFFPAWRVVLTPGQLALAAPAQDSKLAVDGANVAISGGKATILVIPGRHLVVLAASGLLAQDSEQANSSQGTLFGPSTVQFHLRLTQGAQSSAGAALKAALQQCAAFTSSSPGNCPQSYFYAPGAVQWQLLGDPTSDMAVSIGDSGQPAATGHYLMTYSTTNSSGVTQHRTAGGVYDAQFTWDGQKMSVSKLSSGYGAQDLPRPSGATDDMIKAAVVAQFAVCAGITTVDSPDCPQAGFLDLTNGATNIRWSVTGDPLAGAQVEFDGKSSEFLVRGNDTMHVEYDQYVAPKAEDDSHSYIAHVVWTGGKAICIYIEPS